MRSGNPVSVGTICAFNSSARRGPRHMLAGSHAQSLCRWIARRGCHSFLPKMLNVLIENTGAWTWIRAKRARAKFTPLQIDPRGTLRAPPSTPPRADRSRRLTPCAAPIDASHPCRHWRARARGRCARSECCAPDTSASVARPRSEDAAAPRSAVCAVARIDVYSSSLEMSSVASELLVRHRETLLRGRTFRVFCLRADLKTRFTGTITTERTEPRNDGT